MDSEWGLLIIVVILAIVILYVINDQYITRNYLLSITYTIDNKYKSYGGAAFIRISLPDTKAVTGNDIETALFMGTGNNYDDSLLVYRDGRLVDKINYTNLSNHSATQAIIAIDMDTIGLDNLIIARSDGIKSYIVSANGQYIVHDILSKSTNIPTDISLSPWSPNDNKSLGDIYVSNFNHPSTILYQNYCYIDASVGWDNIYVVNESDHIKVHNNDNKQHDMKYMIISNNGDVEPISMPKKITANSAKRDESKIISRNIGAMKANAMRDENSKLCNKGICDEPLLSGADLNSLNLDSTRFGRSTISDIVLTNDIRDKKESNTVILDHPLPIIKKNSVRDIKFINMIHRPIGYFNDEALSESELRIFLASKNGISEYKHILSEYINICIADINFAGSIIYVYYTNKDRDLISKKNVISSDSAYIYHFDLGNIAKNPKLSKIEIHMSDGFIIKYNNPIINNTLVVLY